MSNKEKTLQLEMPFGTANNRLRKKILFSLVVETKRNICFRCKEKIVSIDNFSVDHKKSWLNSDNPKELFFDLANIAFSHMKCNISARRIDKEVSRRNGKKSAIISPEGFAWCGKCKQHLLIKNFNCDKSRRNGFEPICKKCKKELRTLSSHEE